MLRSSELELAKADDMAVEEPDDSNPNGDDVVAAEPDDTSGPSKGRVSRVPAVLITLAVIVAILGATTTWVKLQALDTDSWVDASSQLLQEEDVREAVSTFVVDELYSSVDVGAELEDKLPEELQGLAGPVAGALRGVATDAVERLLDSPRFATLWEEANRKAHETMVKILRDETRDNVSTSDGSVVVSLSGIVKQVGSTIGLPEAALDKIPEDAGQFVVLDSKYLDNAQEVVQVLDFLSWFILLVVVLLYVAAVYFARDRRFTVLRNVGLSLIGAGVALLLLSSLSVNFAINTFIENPANRSLGRTTAYVFTEMLRQNAWSGIIYGALIALFAALLGEHRWAAATRRFVSPIMNGSSLAVAAGTVFFILLLMWWSPGRAFDRWVSALTLVGLIIGAVIALRRRTLSEFPDMTFTEAINSS